MNEKEKKIRSKQKERVLEYLDDWEKNESDTSWGFYWVDPLSGSDDLRRHVMIAQYPQLYDDNE